MYQLSGIAGKVFIIIIIIWQELYQRAHNSITKRKEIKSDIFNKRRWYRTYYRHTLPLV